MSDAEVAGSSSLSQAGNTSTGAIVSLSMLLGVAVPRGLSRSGGTRQAATGGTTFEKQNNTMKEQAMTEHTIEDTLVSINRPNLDDQDERLRNRDECAAIALKDRVLNSPGLSHLAPDGQWEVAISRALDLFEEPRNISELWVWSRFCWAFGRRDTWAANAKLEELLEMVLQISANSTKLSFVPEKEENAEYAKLLQNAYELGEKLEVLLRDVYRNDAAWNDYADFMAFKGRY